MSADEAGDGAVVAAAATHLALDMLDGSGDEDPFAEVGEGHSDDAPHDVAPAMPEAATPDDVEIGAEKVFDQLGRASADAREAPDALGDVVTTTEDNITEALPEHEVVQDRDLKGDMLSSEPASTSDGADAVPPLKNDAAVHHEVEASSPTGDAPVTRSSLTCMPDQADDLSAAPAVDAQAQAFEETTSYDDEPSGASAAVSAAAQASGTQQHEDEALFAVDEPALAEAPAGPDVEDGQPALVPAEPDDADNASSSLLESTEVDVALPAFDTREAEEAGAAEAPAPAAAEKDFSDLLAEFEAEDTTVNAPAATPLAGEDAQQAADAAALLGLDGGDDFAIGIGAEADDHYAPTVDNAVQLAPTAAALFANEDVAFDIGGAEEPDSDLAPAATAAVDKPSNDPFSGVGESSDQALAAAAHDGDEPLDFEVPQGWYDDAGEWHWYTDEERDQVRLVMLGQAAYDSKPVAEVTAVSPSLAAMVSENAARRTPVPADTATMPAQPSLDAYSPSASSRGPGTASYEASAYNPYAPAAPMPNASAQSAPYTPSYAPQQAYAPANAYAPVPSASYSPYTPAAAYSPAYAPPAAGSSKVHSPPKPPQAPRRVASNAYDPPFLKPQKSFVRPASAAPQPITGFSPAPVATPPVASQPLPPPPSGPPKRSKTPVAAPPYEPPPAVPPVPPMPQHFAAAAMQNLQSPYGGDVMRNPPHSDPYGPSAQPQASDPYAPSSYRSSSPPGPQHQEPPAPTAARIQPKPSMSSFDPPLRPASASRPASRPNFASPPARTATPPVMLTPPPGPAAPLGPPRRPSQMLETQPHAKQYAPPRVSSPLKPRGSLGTPYDDGRAVKAERANGWAQPDHRREPARPTVTGLDEEVGDERSLAHWNQSAHDDMSRRGQQTASRVMGDPHRAESRPDFGDYRHSSPLPSHTYNEPRPQSYASPPRQQHASITRQENPYAPASSLGLSHGGSTHLSPEQSYGASNHPPYDDYAPRRPSGSAQPVDAGHAPLQEHSFNEHNPYLSSPRKSNEYNPYSTSPSRSAHVEEPYNPYAPSSQATPATQSLRQQQPAFETPYNAMPTSAGLHAPQTDPYGRATSPAYSSEYGVSPSAPNYFQSAPVDTSYVPQQVLEQRPVSEDPLGRTTMAARNAPLAVFGFGGLLVTAFPAAAEPPGAGMSHSRTPSYGYASGRGQLWIRPVSEVVEASALNADGVTFPGPLVLDPSAPKGAAAEKKRKEAVVVYLDARADEIEKGIPYLKSSASHAKREAEGKLVVVRLLAALVQGDGKFFGTPQAEETVRAALQPPATSSAASLSSYAAPMSNGSAAAPIAPTQAGHAALAHASASHLLQLSALLLQGDKRAAASYAMEHGLWAHALVISSSVDKEMWRDVVSKFGAGELGVAPGTAALKAAYALFSGATAASVDDLVSAANITDDPSADQWREVVSAVVFNGKPPDLMCLDELGSRFAKLGLVNAAQACYLLSPNSPFSDVSPGAFERHVMLLDSSRDDDGTIFAELAEYARSLVPTPKGVEAPFPGLPQLLPYKLQRAWRAAELGDVDVAKKYCQAIEAAAKPGKNARSVLARHLASSMEDLLERITGTPSVNPAGVIGRKRAKSSATIGSWIEGRLTKFIAGEDDGPAQAKPPPKSSAAPVGPFSHFSTISPAPSGAVSRVNSSLDVTHGMHGASPASLHGPFGGGGSGGGPSGGHSLEPSYGSTSSQSSYGEPTGQYGFQSSYTPWAASEPVPEGDADDTDTPRGYEPYGGGEGLINPMDQLHLSQPALPRQDDSYAPPAPSARHERVPDDDDDDLGFGNSSLSRGRTPAPAAASAAEPEKSADKKAEPAKAEATTKSPSLEQKPSGWLRGWFGKKEGEGSGPIRAKLGEESSMVFDPELKRWVVKGAKGDKSGPAPPPPPPRAQTASPSRAIRPDPAAARAMSATPPPSQRPDAPPGLPQRMASAPGGPPAARSGLSSSSFTAHDVPPSISGLPGAAAGMPNGPIPARAPAASLDDLLSRPPSKRPGSAAPKKSARSRYVDVFQPTDGA